jgi:hypothetical protein
MDRELRVIIGPNGTEAKPRFSTPSQAKLNLPKGTVPFKGQNL